MDYRAILSGQRRDPLAVLLRGLLRGAALPYGWAVRRRNRGFDTGRTPAIRVAVPVISVGNLTVGGTGKTPMVAWIARRLRDHGLRVALISRGYGSAAGSENDEALELAERLPDVPHLQNPDRVAAAAVAIEELESQVLLLDDGFQHRRLHRDLDFVLIDATCPFGYGHLLPRGLLREPIAALGRADAVVLTRADQVAAAEREQVRSAVQTIQPAIHWAEATHQPTRLIRSGAPPLPLDWLRNRPIAALGGIGNPGAFFATLEQCGARLIHTLPLPNHFRFDRAQAERIVAQLERVGEAEGIVCTHKDLVKLRTDRFAGRPLMALEVQMQLSAGAAELERQLAEIASRC
jgi:tetraacyldisaccharide 4'-kinase